MDNFLAKHSDKIVSTLSCFDRVVFKGYLPISWDRAFERFLDQQGILYKDFKSFAPSQAFALKAHAESMAKRASRPYLYLNHSRARKEDLVRDILLRDNVSSGLVCVLSIVEPCQSFVLRPATGKPRLQAAQRKCLCLYFYFLDREFGLLHVRIQTYFPFTIQVCLNGHDFLARKMDRHHVGYLQKDNAFVRLDDPQRAQRFADRFAKRNWPRILSAFSRKVNPLLQSLLRGMTYYWVTDQAEYATDLIFKDPPSLNTLYTKLLRHATLCFSAEDVLTFLGRKLHGNFKGEVLNDTKKRLPGARVKHRMTRNWIKMYDKFGVVLRIETVINRPYEFRVRRHGTLNGRKVLGWFPLLKGVAFLPRYQQVALAANHRYIDALTAVEDPSLAYRILNEVCESASYRTRRCRGLNPLRRDDLHLFAAALRGEHALHGIRNRDLLKHLFPSCDHDPALRRKRSARVTRLIQLLRAHRLLAKIPRSRRYRLTLRGLQVMAAAIYLRKEDFQDLISRIPA